MGQLAELKHGSVVSATITSGNTMSSPTDMVRAAIVAKKAYDIGLKVSFSFCYWVVSSGLGYKTCFDIAIQVKPWVRTSLVPGYGVVKEYLLQRFIGGTKLSVSNDNIGSLISFLIYLLHSLQWTARVLGQARIPNCRPGLHNMHLGLWRTWWVNCICYFRKW